MAAADGLERAAAAGGGVSTRKVDIPEGRRMHFLAGILLIVLGLAAITLPLATSMAVVFVLAWVVILAGLVHLMGAFRAWSVGAGIFAAIVGLAYVVIGWTMLSNPVWGLATIALVISVVLLVEGAMTLASYFTSTAESRSLWTLLSGVLAIVLGVVVWSMGAGAAAIVISTIVGINLISSGITRILVGSAVNRLRRVIRG